MPPNDVIETKFEDLKEFMNFRFNQIEAKLSNCDDCKNAATFRERLKSQWFHIVSLWGAVATLTALFYAHVTGRG